MRRLIAGLILLLAFVAPAMAQGCGDSNPNCIVPNRPAGDSTNAAANTRFVTGAVAGSGLSVGSTGISGGTNGRILYDNSGVLGERVPSGTGTTVATSTGSLTSGDCVKIDASGNLVDAGAACASAPAVVLLNTLTASNSPTLQDTTSLTASHSIYEIHIINAVPASNAVTPALQVHSGGSFQATSYSGAVIGWNGSAAGELGNSTAINLSNGGNVSNSTPGLSCTIRVYSPSATGTQKNWLGQCSNNAGGAMSSGWWTGGTGAIDGFQLFFSAGNITSGTVKIYGIN